jgi:hypothetical protein
MRVVGYPSRTSTFGLFCACEAFSTKAPLQV